MRKKIIVFASFILMTFVFSMFRCGLFAVKDEMYNLKSINASLKRITGTELRVDTDSTTCYLVLEDIYNQNNIASIAFDSLAIMVKTDYYFASYAFNRNFPGIQSAYAIPPYHEIYETVTDIIITSNKNYSGKYPAGSNLKEIVSIVPKWYSSNCFVNEITTIDTIIKVFSLREYGRGWYESQLLYLFNIPPETEEVHEITIKYITEKNQVFTAVVKNVKILK